MRNLGRGFLLLLLIVFYSCSAFSSTNDLGGTFTNLESKEKLIEGDIFKAKILIMPLQAGIPSEIRKSLLGHSFLNYFYIADVESIAFSENNSEVLEIYLTAILKKKFEPQPFNIWSYKGLNIPFEIKNIKAEKNASNLKDFFVYNQQVKTSFNISWWGYVLIIALLFLSSLFLFRIFLKKKIEQKKRAKKLEQIQKWQEIFNGADSRAEYENIVLYKSDWQNLLGAKESQLDQFIFSVKKYMYHKEWTESINTEIRDLFDQHRNIFEGTWK